MSARGAFNAIFYNKGEVCSAGSRLFVEGGVHADVITRIIERAARTVPGDPLKATTRLGPLVSKLQLEKVQEYAEAGKKEGAKLLVGGERPKEFSRGYYYKPTVFDCVSNDMKIAREEIFGPVLSVIEFEDFNDVIRKSNDTFYGLAAGIWTKDVSKAIKAAKALKAGTVWVNCYNFFDASAPFGGYKQSGIGRELGLKGIEPYTELKTVWINTE
jgi:acyl-CoA reductase-like NAD-dependent aldehyde dehydrogenase